MKRGWQRVAERADNVAFGRDEVSTAIIPALEQDCRDEMSADFIDDLRSVYVEQDNRLFKDDVGERIEALRSRAGFGLGRTILDNVARISVTEAASVESLVRAVTAALEDRAARGARHAEEHYYRKTDAPRASNVRARWEEGIAGAALDGLARQILKLNAREPSQTILKRQGLDDGVSLR